MTHPLLPFRSISGVWDVLISAVESFYVHLRSNEPHIPSWNKNNDNCDGEAAQGLIRSGSLKKNVVSATLLVQKTNTHTGCSEVFRSDINLDFFSVAFSHRYVGHALMYDVYIKRGKCYVAICRERAHVSNLNNGFATRTLYW